MADLPLLFFPTASRGDPAVRGGGGSPLIKPSPEEQRARHEERFRRILRGFRGGGTSPEGLEPEQVIVLETTGALVAGLSRAAARVPGLEWLAEVDLEDAAPGGGFGYAGEED